MATKAGSASDFDPTKCFLLQDIALWSTTLRRHEDFSEEFDAEKCYVQTRKSASPSLHMAEVEGVDEAVPYLRTLVTFGVRSVTKRDDVEVEMYGLEATFAVDYIVETMPEPDDLQQFVDFNCVHNAWPFWRQHVYDTMKRASLPVPIIPFFSGKPGAGKKRSAKVKKLVQAR